MLTLGFDTATNAGTVGLVDGGEVKGEYTFKAKESQSERLLDSIDLLLKKVGLEIGDVEKVAVSRGPGSFTGLRIGISTAKGIAHGLGIPIAGIPLTDCYYSRVKDYSGPVCTLIEDRRDLVYLAGFDGNGDKIVEEKSLSVDKLKAEVIPGLKKTEDPVLLVGDGAQRHREELEQMEEVVLAEGSLNNPSGLQIAFLGEKTRTERDALAALEPLYAQRPIAEINWNKKSNK